MIAAEAAAAADGYARGALSAPEPARGRQRSAAPWGGGSRGSSKEPAKVNREDHRHEGGSETTKIHTRTQADVTVVCYCTVGCEGAVAAAATARYESGKDRTGQVPSCCPTWRRSCSRAQDAGHRAVVARRRMKAPPSVQYWTVVVAVIGGISGSAAGRRRTASLCCRERDLMPAVLVVDECASRSEGIAGGGVDRHREGGCRQGRAIDDL